MATYNEHVWKNKGEPDAIPINKTNLNEMEAGIGDTSRLLFDEIADRQQIDHEHDTRLGDIEGMIPSQASESNQLADKDFVNSSLSTVTGAPIGVFSSVAELMAYTGEKHLNDYAVVQTMSGDVVVSQDRYKYNGTTWIFEYTMNTTGFTAAQVAAINSGATKAKIDSITGKESTTNRVNIVNASSDNAHYPSAKAVYSLFASIAIFDGEVEAL